MTSLTKYLVFEKKEGNVTEGGDKLIPSRWYGRLLRISHHNHQPLCIIDLALLDILEHPHFYIPKHFDCRKPSL